MSDLGMHFIIGLSGAELSAADKEILSLLKPLGVILRAHNFASKLTYPEWLKPLKAMIKEVSVLTGRSNPVIAFDHEGGRVHRTPPPLTQFPSAMRYAKAAKGVGEAHATELLSIGVNLSFGPVLDIHSNPQNPVIGERAFGKTPEQVISTAIPYAKALLAGGVMCVLKHFPGHGDTHQDSHEELPTLELSESDLTSRELLPFEAGVKAGLPSILTAHILFPKIDKKYPATLSSKVLRHLLRDKLGFKGVVISDDLDMKAIADNFSEKEIAEHAFEAGCDILLFNHAPRRTLKVLEYLDANKLKASSERVREFHKKILKPEVTELQHSVFEKHAKLAQSLC